jgi:hypothetical protein
MGAEFQYLMNADGEKIAVVISMEDWKNISPYVDELLNLSRIGASIKQGMKEAKMIERGELDEVTLSDFINEL